MIVYTKLWETLKERNISQYKLINTYGISTGQLDRLRKNEREKVVGEKQSVGPEDINLKEKFY